MSFAAAPLEIDVSDDLCLGDPIAITITSPSPVPAGATAQVIITDSTGEVYNQGGLAIVGQIVRAKWTVTVPRIQ